MRIQPARAQDLPRIKQLYDEAIAFQRAGGHPYWKDVDMGVVEYDIAGGCQYALLLERQIAGIFSLCPPSSMDRDLWRDLAPGLESESEPARHINRVIVARQWRGQQLFAPMLAWCEQEALRQGIGLLRLDTWAENTSLVNYYSRFGFMLAGERTTATRQDLPPQYRGVRLALMQRSIVLAAPALL